MEDFVITRFNSLFKAHDPKGHKTHFKNRKFACFIITLKGKIRFSCDGGEVIASAGHPVFLPKDLTYVNECLETAESLVFNFYTLHSYQHPLALAPVSDALADPCCGTNPLPVTEDMVRRVLEAVVGGG